MGTIWQEAHGDETYALDWSLDENSHVWEIGGFEGRWAQQIWDKFHCNITIFEPQLWAVDRLRKRFDGIDKIDIRPYGLWTEDILLPMGNYHTDGASVVNHDGREEKQFGSFKSYYPEIFFYKSKHIDVCLMNIEGAEYNLIPRIVESGAIKKIVNFWCQFHPESVNDMRHETIYDDLSETHGLLWNFFPTAVAWRKK